MVDSINKETSLKSNCGIEYILLLDLLFFLNKVPQKKLLSFAIHNFMSLILNRDIYATDVGRPNEIWLNEIKYILSVPVK